MRGAFFLIFSCLFNFLWVLPVRADETVALKYSNRPEQTQVSILKDIRGKDYLPLAEVAQFYGITLSFDAQTRRVTLQKGGNQARLALSQPVFLAGNPSASYSVEPAETVSGQLGIPPDSAADLLAVLFNASVRYDQNILTVGEVTPEELRKEILAEARQKKAKPVPTVPPVVNVVPTPSPTAEPEQEETVEKGKPSSSQVEEAPAAQTYHVHRIIIDPGHGGKDSGAKGFSRGFMKKEATLDIANRLAKLLKKEPDLEILMTRDSDYYVTLKGRCEFANRHQGDVFVSIHCNSNPKKTTTGTKTYVYSPHASNRLAAVAAARENGKNEDVVSMLADLHHRTYLDRSNRLAMEVDRRIRDNLNQHIQSIQGAPFYVLRQVDMPSILVETAFLSNRAEEMKLMDPRWRDEIAESIADGILSFRDIVEGSIDNRQARR